MADKEPMWNEDLQEYMKTVCASKEDADITVWVENHLLGTAHKFLLNANSSILKLEECNFNKETGMLDVYLSSEFSEYHELIASIISGFYTGVISCSSTEDAKFLYKFAINYSVRWLAQKALKELQKSLNDDTFVELFKFAHSIGSNDLKNICSEYMNPEIAGQLIASDDLKGLDYNSVKTLAAINDCQKLEALQKFRLLKKWYELDTESRSCHIENLLNEVQYFLIGTADIVDIVLPWILDSANLQDETTLRMMRKIKDSKNTAILNVCEPINAIEISTNPPVRPFMLIKDVEEIICQMFHYVENMTTFKGEHPTNEEVIAAVYYKWKDLDVSGRRSVMEYICNRSSVLLCKQNITDIVLLYDNSDFSFKELMLMEFDKYKWLFKYVDCTVISSNTLKAALLDILPINLDDVRMSKICVFIIEMLMNWSLAHPDEANKIRTILYKICTCNLPFEYMQDILVPYLDQFSLLNSSCNYICGLHKVSELLPGQRERCYTQRLTPKMYLLQKDSVKTAYGNTSLYLDLSGTHCLYVVNLGVSLPFLLYNLGTVIKNWYPSITSYCIDKDSLSIDELKEMLAEYRHLHVMFFYKDVK